MAALRMWRPQEDAPEDEEAAEKAIPEELPSKVLMQAFTMTFLAEWGDRSQIATIALVHATRSHTHFSPSALPKRPSPLPQPTGAPSPHWALCTLHARLPSPSPSPSLSSHLPRAGGRARHVRCDCRRVPWSRAVHWPGGNRRQAAGELDLGADSTARRRGALLPLLAPRAPWVRRLGLAAPCLNPCPLPPQRRRTADAPRAPTRWQTGRSPGNMAVVPCPWIVVAQKGRIVRWFRASCTLSAAPRHGGQAWRANWVTRRGAIRRTGQPGERGAGTRCLHAVGHSRPPHAPHPQTAIQSERIAAHESGYSERCRVCACVNVCVCVPLWWCLYGECPPPAAPATTRSIAATRECCVVRE